MASSAASSASAFARSLPSARITTHDPRLFQILNSPANALARGDFGLKYAILPAVAASRQGKRGALRNLHVRELDSGRGIGTAWDEREHEALLLQRWQETHAPVSAERSLSEASNDEWGRDGIKTEQPAPVSRFDRSSRKMLNSAARPATSSSATGAATQSSSTMPNYLLYSRERFAELLETVRSRRADFIEEQLQLAAVQRRRQQYEQALARRQEGSQPKLEDFSLEEAYNSVQAEYAESKSSGQESAAVLTDMFDLSRSYHQAHGGVSFLRHLLTSVDDPKSTLLPISRRTGGSSVSNRLHTLGGLQYSQPDPIFARILGPALPGRNLDRLDRQRNRVTGARSGAKSYLSGIGSHVVRSQSNRSNVYDPTGANNLQGTGLFRMLKADLIESRPAQGFHPDQRMATKHAAWTTTGRTSSGFDLEALGLGYIDAEAFDVIPDQQAENNAHANDARSRLPGSAHWVLHDSSELQANEARRRSRDRHQRLAEFSAQSQGPARTLDSVRRAEAQGKPYVSQYHGGGALSGQLAAHSQNSGAEGVQGNPVGSNSNSSRINLGKENAASRRLRNLRSAQGSPQGESEGEGGSRSRSDGRGESPSARAQDLLGFK